VNDIHMFSRRVLLCIRRGLLRLDCLLRREGKDRNKSRYWKLMTSRKGTVKRMRRGEYNGIIYEVSGNVCACAGEMKRRGHDVGIESLHSISIVAPGEKELGAMKFEYEVEKLRKKLQKRYPGIGLKKISWSE